MKLNIKINRPLIFFDLETTGIDVNNDRILELCAFKFFPDERECDKMYLLLNPVKTISIEATEKHGHTNQSLSLNSKFIDKVDEIADFFHECDLAGHNSNHFDIQLLASEFKRSGYQYDLSSIKMVDTRKIYLANNPKDLTHLYKEYTGKDLKNAHAAEADVIATIEIFNKQTEKYDISTIEQADIIGKTDKNGNKFLDLDGKFVKSKEGKYLFNFGKHNGDEVSIENVGFIGWMLTKDFSENTKYVAEKLKNFILKINKREKTS